MSGVKVDFIGQLIIDTRITLTEGAEASSKQLVADTLFTAIKVVLYQFLTYCPFTSLRQFNF